MCHISIIIILYCPDREIDAYNVVERQFKIISGYRLNPSTPQVHHGISSLAVCGLRFVLFIHAIRRKQIIKNHYLFHDECTMYCFVYG